MIQTRMTYLRTAGVALELIRNPDVAARWNEASVLKGMSIGVLASHLARSILQVNWFLDGELAKDSAPVPAVVYYARLSDKESRTSSLNAGVESRSTQTASQGPGVVAGEAQAALDVVTHRLEVEPSTRRVAVAHRPGEELLLDEYLRTRLVELSVHIEDLALSVDVVCDVPAEAVSSAVDLLVSAARERHGDLAVLHALARRERDGLKALRVL